MFFTPKISEGVERLIKAMCDDPTDWFQGHYEFICKSKPDLRIWTANGAKHIKIFGNDCFTGAEKRAIANGIKLSTALRLEATMKEENL